MAELFRHREGRRKTLLGCGILSSLLYVAMLIVVPMRWPSYSSAAQTVSELSAIGAPTRSLWVVLGAVYTVLVVAFGAGLWMSAERDPRLRRLAGALIAYGVIGLFWPPMHMRGAMITLTDSAHVVFMIITLLLMLFAMDTGAVALGGRFRLYTVASILFLIGFGVLTGINGPRIVANLPTPLVGVWQRIDIGLFLLWLMVLAVVLLSWRSPAMRRIGRPRSSDLSRAWLEARPWAHR